MKKFISFILSFLLSFGTMAFCGGKIYSVAAEKISLNNFIEAGIELIRENDAGKEFIPEIIKTEDADVNEDSIASIKKSASAKAKSLTENDDDFSDTAFQTCRLIVKSSKTPDKLNSTGIASGFKDWHIVQFATEENAKSAYYYYLNQREVAEVFPDVVYEPLFDKTEYEENVSNISIESSTSQSRLNSWGSIETGLYDLKDYIEDNVSSKKEIVVGVVDTGIEKNNPFFENRIIKYFTTYTEEDESLYDYHGTQVSATIVDNTNDNVKIAMYKFSMRQSSECAEISPLLCFLQAVNDSVNIINCSFGMINIYDEMWEDALDLADDKKIPVFAAAGNEPENICFSPAKFESIYTVAACGQDALPCRWTSYGKQVDFLAPGEDIPLIHMEEVEWLGDTEYGTSLSCPLAVSEFVLLMTMFPGKSNEQIAALMKKSCNLTDFTHDYAMYGCGVIDAIGASGIKRNTTPQFNIPDGKYVGKTEVEITSEPGCETYYTLDGSYPSKENGILYTCPVILPDSECVLKAVTYGNSMLKSECTKGHYRVQHNGTDDMFEISDDGQIIAYTGDINDLIIPETINGITVTGIASGTFSRTNLAGVTFPDTMTEVSFRSFENNQYIKFADGNKIKTIGEYAFDNCTNLLHVNFPLAEEVEYKSFENCYALEEVVLPACSRVNSYAFFYCKSIKYVSLPKIEYIGFESFEGCKNIIDMNISNVSVIQERFPIGSKTLFESKVMMPLDLPNLKQVTWRTFNNSSFDRIEFSNVEEIKSAPDIGNGLIDLKGLALPSTLINCNLRELKENTIIYGSRGTYAEQWANENCYDFIEITPETAIINDLPAEYCNNMHYLYADVVGFNRTYQWYGSYSDKKTGGFTIDGATERKFIPKDHEQYPYYYCEVISTDVGYEPIKIKTGVSKYLEFEGEIPFADYSKLDEILSTVPSDLSIYTDDSVEALNTVLESIDRNLDISSQDTVDGFVDAISKVLSNLKIKKYSVIFMADEETVSEYSLEYGTSIATPAIPEKEGYIFKEWLPKIPETMPSKDMTFYAVFEKEKQPEFKPSVSIRNYAAVCTVDYRTTITFTAITDNMTDEASIVWYENGKKVGTGEKYTVKDTRDAFNIQAKIVDGNGKILNSTETELVKVKTDFFSRLIAFFRMLFGKLPIMEQ